MDLVLRRATLMGGVAGGTQDIGVVDGRIVEIAPKIAITGREEIDLGGRLLTPGLVESHIHLDKSRIIDRCPPEAGRNAANAVKRVQAAKRDFTVADVYERAKATLEAAILQGTTRMRTHVEVDPSGGLIGLEAIEALARDYRWAIDLEICAFLQEGMTGVEGAEALLVQAIERGDHVSSVGGAPGYDSDHMRQITRLFELARAHDLDVDLHLDFGNTPEAMDIHGVIELADQYRYGGRVNVGHVTKLSTLPPEKQAPIARRLADVGVAVTVLPATDLFLMGRDQTHDVRRGIVDVNAYDRLGVTCSIANNNILNPFTPFGDCSLVRMANLHANTLQVSGRDDLRACFEMVSSDAARILNLGDYGLAVGHPADFAVLDAKDEAEAVAVVAPVLHALKRGRHTVTRRPADLHRPA
ncbi:MAG TPA: amidohydrolase family protein [Stellaceae bacterium]|nr:amidohydrolase family protein [Stellaceae bacterium]